MKLFPKLPCHKYNLSERRPILADKQWKWMATCLNYFAIEGDKLKVQIKLLAIIMMKL